MDASIQTASTGLEDIARRFYEINQYPDFGSYSSFASVGARLRLAKIRKIFKQRRPDDPKEVWRLEVEKIGLEAIVMALKKIQAAKRELEQGDLATSALMIGECGVWFGRITMLYDLSCWGLLQPIGSIVSARSGASKGGIQSGLARRANTRIPNAAELYAERRQLLSEGKGVRDVARVLATRHGCSADHIRKLLKTVA